MRISSITKKNVKNTFIIAFIIALMLSLTASASALGVSPAKKTVYFEPNQTVELNFKVINSDALDVPVFLNALGDLQDRMFFSEGNKLLLQKDVGIMSFKVFLNLPEEMSPGVHTTYIKLTPQFPSTGNMLRAFAAPMIPVLVRVPYPSKYAEVDLAIQEVDEGTAVPVLLEFDNLGSEDIAVAEGSVTLINLAETGTAGEESLIGSTAVLECPKISVGANSYGKTACEPTQALRSGEYLAQVRSHYDNTHVDFDRNVSIGKPIVRVTHLATRNILTKRINTVVFGVRSEWNRELLVTGFIRIDGFQTEMPLVTLAPGEEKEVIGYFDATDTTPGLKNMSIMLGYADQIRTEDYLVSIEEGEPEAEPPTRLIGNMILAVAIIVVLAAIAIMLKNVLRKKRE
ncbi:hypothetical protein JW711_03660 [Candidatus Woesearchaeota archaeon]|nr:hypothetical protein [Candidatus Woesearchaeota archaeon]